MMYLLVIYIVTIHYIFVIHLQDRIVILHERFQALTDHLQPLINLVFSPCCGRHSLSKKRISWDYIIVGTRFICY